MFTRKRSCSWRCVGSRATAIGGLSLAAMLAACSGSTGSQGPAGAAGATGPQGPPGAAGPITALDVSTATALTGTIKSVTIGSPPVVKFQLTDQNGVPLRGLPAADISFLIAQLAPGTNGSASQWTSYIYRTATPAGCPPGVTSCNSAPTTQPTTESATKGTFVDNGDGTYQYTFAKDITTDPIVKYDPTLTHRVAFEIRGLAQANNGAYTFQPSSGATTNIFSREIVDTATCDQCHGFLNAHGGARVETQYCVMCHSPQNTDPYSGNTLDFKVMVHKIHTGINLPSINTVAPPNTTPTLGQGYWIVGFMRSLNNFNTVLFPQDTRNCTTCHAQNHPNLTEAANYKSVPTMEACGACHDTVNFATGANHSTNIVANNTQCTTCHGPMSNIDNGALQVAAAHTIPDAVAATRFQFNVNKVTFTVQGGSTYPVVNFSIVDPTNSNHPYNILADTPFVGVNPADTKPVCADGKARLALDIAWDTSDYTNWGRGSTPSAWGQPLSFNPLTPYANGVPASCAATSIPNRGAGYVTGTYPSVSITGGSGTGMMATIVVSAAGTVSSVAVTTAGTGYLPTDVLSASNASLGGPGAGLAFSVTNLGYGGAAVPATPAPATLYGPDANGAFTAVAPTALPAPPATNCANGMACAPVQNVVAVLEGHPAVVTPGPGAVTTPPAADSIPVASAVGYGNTAGAAPAPRRPIVAIAQCDVCHKALSLHGGNRNDNVQVCVVCHNPASTDVSQRQLLAAPGVDGLWEQTIDLKRHIHAIHSDSFRSTQPGYTPWIIYGFGNSVHNFSDVVFPQDVGNCYACHTVDPVNGPTFYPGDTFMQASTTDTGKSKNPADPANLGGMGPISTTPTMSACTGCHVDPLVMSHMEQNGGSTMVLKDAEGRMLPASNPAGVETCAICHGPGAVADVAKVHNVIPPAQ